jgi:hypothetical protein
MTDFVERFEQARGRWKDVGSEFLSRLRERNRKWGLIALLVLFAIELAGRALLTESTTTVLIWIGKGMRGLARQPVGYAGLVLAGALVILLGLSWWDTRPQPEKDKAGPPPAPPSPHERKLIQDIREIWEKHGKQAVRQMRDLLSDASDAKRKQLYWSRFLDRQVQDFSDSIAAFEESLSQDKSVEDVRKRFNAMYREYLNAINMIGEMAAHDDMPVKVGGRKFSERMDWWEDSHFLFNYRLESLVTNPDHAQTLEIFPSRSTPFERPQLAALLSEAEDVDDHIDLLPSDSGATD